MKNIKQLKQELELLKDEIRAESDIKKENKLRKKIPKLNTCILYLESNPNENFLRAEIERIESKINLRMAQFVLDGVDEKPKSFVTKLKKQHEKQYEIPKLREQVRVLRYLLK